MAFSIDQFNCLILLHRVFGLMFRSSAHSKIGFVTPLYVMFTFERLFNACVFLVTKRVFEGKYPLSLSTLSTERPFFAKWELSFMNKETSCHLLQT